MVFPCFHVCDWSPEGQVIEHVLIQTPHGLAYPGFGEGEVDAEVPLAVEHGAVLEGDADVPAELFELGQGPAVGPAPVFAVGEEHVGALGLEKGYAVEIFTDVSGGKADVAGQDLAELVDPPGAFGAVGTDEGVHGEDVHLVVVAEGGLLADPVPEGAVVDDVIAAHEARQVEGLGGGVEGHRPVAGVVADALAGDVGVAGQDQVGPDLVAYDMDVIFFEEGVGALKLFALPDAAAGVVGRAEDGCVNVPVPQLFFHVVVVHAGDAVFVGDEGRVDDVPAVVAEGVGEADVGWCVDEDVVAGGAHDAQSADQAAEDAVFVADAFFCQAFDAVAAGLPADDGVIVFVCGREIAEGGVVDPLMERLCD